MSVAIMGTGMTMLKQIKGLQAECWRGIRKELKMQVRNRAMFIGSVEQEVRALLVVRAMLN